VRAAFAGTGTHGPGVVTVDGVNSIHTGKRANCDSASAVSGVGPVQRVHEPILIVWHLDRRPDLGLSSSGDACGL
jgi:hypothetical protein